jgi:WD40 repeat protein
MRYKAFISYSHTYLGLARALQDALYRFGTPWYERSGPQIFRDESGLAASPDLWEILRAALDESEYFIYLASPESAGSFYTQKEVGYWLAHRGPDSIIMALAKGNIQYDEDAGAFDPKLSDALPDVLHTAFEDAPLFVDLREVTDANSRLSDVLFRDKVATIASALHGKSKDELYGMQVTALIMSDAERMARDAQAAIAERLSDRALLLAAHALRLTEAQGEARVPEAEAALRQALCLAGGRPLGRLDNRARPPYSVNADGGWLCTVHADDETKIWDLTTADEPTFEPALICRLPTPSWVQLSRDGSWLVAVQLPSSDDSTTQVQVWDLRENPATRAPLHHDGVVVQADVSPRGDFLALSTIQPTGLMVWHLPPREAGASGGTQPDGPELLLDHRDTSDGRFAFSPDDTALCRYSGNQVAVWRLGRQADQVTSRNFTETARVDACRVTPQGETLVMLVDKTPQVVRLGPGNEFERIVIEELNDDIVHDLDVSPDGRWGLLLSNSGPSYAVELEQPTESGFTITSTGGTTNRYAFSPNGHWLATAAGPMEKYPELQVEEPEFVVRLRSLLIPGSLEEIVLAGHDDLITNVSFSPDSNAIVTCSVDRTVRVWDISRLNAVSEALAALLRESDPEVLIRDFGLSEQNLAKDLQEVLEFLRTELIQAASRFPAEAPQILLADDGAPPSATFSGDGSWLASTQMTMQNDTVGRLWDMRWGSACAAPIRMSTFARIDNFDRNQTCAMSRDGRWLVVLQTCALWRLQPENGSGRGRPALHDVGQFEVENAELSHGGDFLLLYAGGKLMLTSLVDDDVGMELDTAQTPVRDAFITEDDRWVVARCGTDNAEDPVDVRAWPVQHASEHSSGFVVVSGSQTLNLCECSPSGRWLLASEDGVIRLWDLDRDDPRASERLLIEHRGRVADVHWSRDEQSLVSAGEDGRLLCWPLSDSRLNPTSEEMHAVDTPLRSISSDADQRRIFTGGAEGRGTLLTLDSQLGVTERWNPPGCTGDVTGFLSSSGRWLSIWDRHGVTVFDVARRAEHLDLPSPPNGMDLSGKYRYSSDERWLVVSRRGRLVLIDLRVDRDAHVIDLPGHRHEIVVFRITRDAHWLVSIDRPINEPVGYVPVQTCRIWDLWSPDPAGSCVILPDLPFGVDRIEITPDDRWLITSSRDGVRAWPLGTEHLLAVAQQSIGREPSEEERLRYAFTSFESEPAQQTTEQV